jgi:hypothetical protein
VIQASHHSQTDLPDLVVFRLVLSQRVRRGLDDSLKQGQVTLRDPFDILWQERHNVVVPMAYVLRQHVLVVHHHVSLD